RQAYRRETEGDRCHGPDHASRPDGSPRSVLAAGASLHRQLLSTCRTSRARRGRLPWSSLSPAYDNVVSRGDCSASPPAEATQLGSERALEGIAAEKEVFGLT